MAAATGAAAVEAATEEPAGALDPAEGAMDLADGAEAAAADVAAGELAATDEEAVTEVLADIGLITTGAEVAGIGADWPDPRAATTTLTMLEMRAGSADAAGATPSTEVVMVVVFVPVLVTVDMALSQAASWTARRGSENVMIVFNMFSMEEW